MKRTISALIAALLLFTVFAPLTYAATKNDIIGEVKKSVFSRHLTIQIENMLRSVSLTSEECDQVLIYVKDGLAFVKTDKGKTSHEYTTEEMDYIVALCAKICNYLGYTYEYVPSKNPKHVNDIVYKVYDKNGKLIFEYDGDLSELPKKTDEPFAEAESSGSSSNFLLIFGITMLLMTAGSVVISRKAEKLLK